jgi:protein-S-isoprenylcysteine O-methyltransferase Ste14
MVYFLMWVLFSLVLLGFTLSRPHPYRCSRFLAFDSLLGLIFLNAKKWFSDPFSVLQAFSWLLLVGSLLLAVHVFFLIKTRGNPDGNLGDTTSIIMIGAYRYIRHPLYTSLLLLGLGAFLKDPSIPAGCLLATTFLGVYLTAGIEEGHNLDRFGEKYKQYSKRTKRFIPYLF